MSACNPVGDVFVLRYNASSKLAMYVEHFDPSVWNQYSLKTQGNNTQWCGVNCYRAAWGGGGISRPVFFLLKIVSLVTELKGDNKKIGARMRERCVSILRFDCNRFSPLILKWLLFKLKFLIPWSNCAPPVLSRNVTSQVTPMLGPKTRIRTNQSTKELRAEQVEVSRYV
jgi:hypothetical protein